MLEITKYARLVQVQKRPPEMTKILRQQFKDWKLSKALPFDTNLYSYHHIIGLSVGGSNNCSNLIVMEKTNHELLHRRYLDPQTRNLKEGGEALLLLPVSYDLQSEEFKMYDKLYKEMMSREFYQSWKEARLWEKGYEL